MAQLGAKSQGARTVPGNMIACGYQQVTGMSAATALTVPDDAIFAIIQAETQNVRWRDDGTSPTSTVGMILASGSSIQFSGNLSGFKAIQVTSGAILNVTYYK